MTRWRGIWGKVRQRLVSDRALRRTHCAIYDALEPRLLMTALEPLVATAPSGSLIHQVAVEGQLNEAQPSNVFTTDIDAGQTITVVVDPLTTLQPTLQVIDAADNILGTASADAPGDVVLLQTVAATVAATFRIEVAGSGAWPEDYRLEVILNGAVEEESYGNATNDQPGTGQDLSSSFVDFGLAGAARAAVVGALSGAEDDWFAFSLPGHASATLVLTALTEGDLDFELYDDLATNLLALGRTAGTEEVIENFVDQTINGSDTTYHVRVFGQDAEYNLIVLRDSSFDLEPNSSFDDAVNLSGIGQALGHADNLNELATQFSVPLLNIDGEPFNGATPPDPVGDVGIDYFIQMTNAPGGAQFSIFDKAEGVRQRGPIILGSLAPPGSPGSLGGGDPIVLYDHLADRWLLSEFGTTTEGLSVYISQTDDPTDNLWYHYFFETAEVPDFPKLAVWPDGYYLSTNESSPAAYVLDRTSMLAGLDAADPQRRVGPLLTGFDFQAFTPGDLDGPPPPAEAPAYFLRHRDDEIHNRHDHDEEQDFIEVWAFHADHVDPDQSTFSQLANVAVSEFDSHLCGLVSQSCIPQPNTQRRLDPVREVIMNGVKYRNFSTHETLLGNFVTDADGTDHAAVRWFELRKVGDVSWTLHQEGTIAPDANHRWLGSMAMDTAGNIAVAYNISSSTVSPGLRYSGRLAGDEMGTLALGEHVLVDGQSAHNSNRWGDYTSMSVDPVDDRTFWFTGPYARDQRWQTRIGSFRITEASDSDWYRFAVAEGDDLVIRTAIPAKDPGEFVNDLDPLIELFGAQGNQLASDDNSAPDGRNALLEHAALTAGPYRVRVTGVSSRGTYVLSVDGATGANAVPSVIGTAPNDAAASLSFPSHYVIHFSETILASSVQAADLLVDGLPAVDVVHVDGDTLQFTIDPAVNEGVGIYSVELIRDAVFDLQGQANAVFNATFEVDTVGPNIISTLWNGLPFPADATLAAGDLRFDASLSEKLNMAFRAGQGLREPGPDDLVLVNQTTGQSISAQSTNYDTESNTFTAHFPALSEGAHRLTLLSADDAFEDELGNDLDGEPHGGAGDGTPTGDGQAGGDYVLDFLVENDGPVRVRSFDRLEPLGGLIARSHENVALINTDGEVEDFLFSGRAGQFISATVRPDDPLASVTIELVGVTGQFTAPAGEVAMLAPTTLTTDGDQRLRISADRGTSFALDIYLNAAVEGQHTDGDSGPGSELALDATALSLGPGQRWAVVGRHNGDDDVDSYHIDLDGTGPLDIVLAGQSGADFSGANLDLVGIDGTTILATAVSDPLNVDATNFDLAIFDAIVPSAGIYTVRLKTIVPGDYGLVMIEGISFDSEPNSFSGNQLRDITDSGAALGMISRLDATGLDRYLVDIEALSQVTVSIHAIFDGPANDLDPAVLIIGPNATLVAMDDGLPGPDVSINFQASETGTYFVRLSADDGEGEYLVEVDEQPAPGPRVVEVRIRGASWPIQMLSHLEQSGFGSGGFQVSTGSPAQLSPLPWPSIDQVLVRFDEDVLVTTEDLTVSGAVVAAFEYDLPSFTGIWTLDRPLPSGRVNLMATATNRLGIALDGEWIDSVSSISGNGMAGGDLAFTFNVLEGDLNRDARTDIDDLTFLLNAFNDTVPTGDFSQGDITSANEQPDGTVDIDDLTALLNRFNDELSPPAGTGHDSLGGGTRALNLAVAPVTPARVDSAGRSPATAPSAPWLLSGTARPWNPTWTSTHSSLDATKRLETDLLFGWFWGSISPDAARTGLRWLGRTGLPPSQTSFYVVQSSGHMEGTSRPPWPLRRGLDWTLI